MDTLQSIPGIGQVGLSSRRTLRKSLRSLRLKCFNAEYAERDAEVAEKGLDIRLGFQTSLLCSWQSALPPLLCGYICLKGPAPVILFRRSKYQYRFATRADRA